MYYVPPSIYIGEQIGKAIGALICAIIKFCLWIALHAIYILAILFNWLLKGLFLFILPKLWELMKSGYHRYRQHRAMRYYVR